MPRILVLGVCLAAAIALPPAASAVVLERSDPSIGGTLPGGQPVELEFSGPISIAPDGVLLLDAAGNPLPVGQPEAAAADVVRIPLDGTGSGLRTLSWTGAAPDDEVPVRGSITFDAGGASTGTLDVAGIARAAEASALALVLLVTSLVALTAATVLGFALRRRRASRTTALTGIIVGAAAAVTIAALLGLIATVGQSGDFVIFAAACVAAIIGALLGVGAIRTSDSPRTVVALSALSVVVSAVALVGATVADRPVPVAPDAQKQVLLDQGGQVSLTMAPSAVGANAVTVGLRDVEESPDDRPVLILRPLDGRIGPMRIPLTRADDGAYGADRVLLPLAGRWRSQVEGVSGITEDDPAVLDFDVIPNEEVQDGSGS